MSADDRAALLEIADTLRISSLRVHTITSRAGLLTERDDEPSMLALRARGYIGRAFDDVRALASLLRTDGHHDEP